MTAVQRIIPKRHASYQLVKGTVRSVTEKSIDAATGLPAHEPGEADVVRDWVEIVPDDHLLAPFGYARRFPLKVASGHPVYILRMKDGITAKPNRPVYIHDVATQGSHYESVVPAPYGPIAVLRHVFVWIVLALLLAVGAHEASVHSASEEVVTGLSLADVAVIAIWIVVLVADLRTRVRAKRRLSDERETVDEVRAIIAAETAG